MSSLESVFEEAHGPSLCIIAEAGVNHDGDVADAHALIDLAADAGADVVKFQTFEPELLVSAAAPTARYQAGATEIPTQLELLQQYVLPRGAWTELVSHAGERGLAFMSTPFDHASLDLVCELGVTALKLGSGELTNKPLLQDAARRGLSVVCSTGMATDDEVAEAVGWLAAAPRAALLHCVSSYPAPVEQANLRAIPAMSERFGVPVGWSDHTIDVVSAVAAVALGACILEKHVTLDRGRHGPDHAASADAEGFRSYVQDVRRAAEALGDGVKRPAPAEEENIDVVRRSWHARRGLGAGERLSLDDLVLLRPAGGLPPSVEVVGRRLSRPVAAGAPVLLTDVEEAGDA